MNLAKATVFWIILSCITATANAEMIDLTANFHLLGEVNRLNFLGWGDMTVNFGVNPTGGSVSGTEIGKIEFTGNTGASATSGVLSPLNIIDRNGWQVVDFDFSVSFTIDDFVDASMFIGLGTNYIGSAAGASGSVRAIFDFSDNIWYQGSILQGSFDQGLSLTSVTLSDGTSLEDSGYQFEIIAENTTLSAFATAADDRGQISAIIDTAPGTEKRAAVFPFGGTASSKLLGGINRAGVPTEALVNLDVNPEPNGLVFDLAGASIGGDSNIRLYRTDSGPAPVPEPTTFLLFGLGLLGLTGVSRKKTA